jgi:hypothetical protein
MEALRFAILALAVYRTARMLALEAGPFELFARWRGWAEERGAPEWMIEGFGCPLCLSFWLSWAAALLLPWQGVAWYVATALALSGAAVALVKQERPEDA